MYIFPDGILPTIKGFCKQLLEKLMLVERDQYLRDNIETKGNGFYSRNLSSYYGEISNLQVPRTRDAKFKSQLIPNRNADDHIELLTNLMFRAGVSTRKISSILQECFGCTLSHTTIASMADIAYEEVLAWKNRPLAKDYAAVFIDAFYFPLKRDSVEKEAVYTAMGITPEGRREVIDFWIPGGCEGASNWEEILREIRSRGTKNIDFIVADGLKGIQETILRTYPQAKYQSCILHASRSSLNKVRAQDKQQIGKDLKQIYHAETIIEAEKKFDVFKEKWGKTYPKVAGFWEENFEVLTAFMVLPSSLRKYVYTTNWLERSHKEIKRRINAMEQFQNEHSAEKILYGLYSEQNKRHQKTGINSWRELYEAYRKKSREKDNKIYQFENINFWR